MVGKLAYKIEVLTPVHVGSGQELSPSDYILDHNRQQVVRVNLSEMFKAKGFPINRFINAIKQPGFNLGREYGRVAALYPKYTLDAGENLAELSRWIGRPAGHIHEHIKDGGKPYIPGSSIKGALRSVILRYLYGIYGSEYEESVRRQLAKHKEKRVRKEFFSSPAEKRILGDPNHSLLRLLQVSDSSVVDASEMSLGCIKVLTLGQRSFRWKVLGSEQNLDDYEEATPVFFEALCQGTEISGRLKIDEILLRGELRAALGYSSEKIESVTRLAGTCRECAGELLNKEQRFYEKINFKTGFEAVDNLKQMLKSCRDNEMIFSMAWGGGYLAKAAGWKIDKDLMDEIRDEFRMGRENFEFPKSRKINFANGMPAGLIGWVKMTLEEE